MFHEHKNRHAWSGVLPPAALLCLLALVLLGGCKDKPTQPDPEPLPMYSEYPVYFTDAFYGDYVYEYYPGTNQLDSIAVTSTFDGSMVVGSNGNRLFVGTIGHGTKVIDLVARQEEAQIDFDGQPAVSPDGDLLVIAGDGIRFYNAHTLELVHSIDTLNGMNPWFVADTSLLYCQIRNNWYDTVLAIIDISDTGYPVQLRNLNPVLPRILSIRSLEASPDGDELFVTYLNRYGSQRYYFAAADLVADSLLYDQALFPSSPAGGMAVTPDGHRVFVAHPGNTMNIVIHIGPAEFLYYDVAENELDTQRVEGLGIVWPLGRHGRHDACRRHGGHPRRSLAGVCPRVNAGGVVVRCPHAGVGRCLPDGPAHPPTLSGLPALWSAAHAPNRHDRSLTMRTGARHAPLLGVLPLAALLYLLTFVLLTGCKDKSTQPDPEPLPQYSAYPVYFTRAGDCRVLFQYYPGTDYLDSATPAAAGRAVNGGKQRWRPALRLGWQLRDQGREPDRTTD